MPLLEKLEETEEDHIDYAKDIKTVSQIKSATLARLERHMGGCTTQSLRLPEWISGEFDEHKFQSSHLKTRKANN